MRGSGRTFGVFDTSGSGCTDGAPDTSGGGCTVGLLDVSVASWQAPPSVSASAAAKARLIIAFDSRFIGPPDLRRTLHRCCSKWMLGSPTSRGVLARRTA